MDEIALRSQDIWHAQQAWAPSAIADPLVAAHIDVALAMARKDAWDEYEERLAQRRRYGHERAAAR